MHGRAANAWCAASSEAVEDLSPTSASSAGLRTACAVDRRQPPAGPGRLADARTVRHYSLVGAAAGSRPMATTASRSSAPSPATAAPAGCGRCSRATRSRSPAPTTTSSCRWAARRLRADRRRHRHHAARRHGLALAGAAPLAPGLCRPRAGELVFADELRAALGERCTTFAVASGRAARRRAPSWRRCRPRRSCWSAVRSPCSRGPQAWARSRPPAADLRFETFGSGGRRRSFGSCVPRQGGRVVVPADRTPLEALAEHGVAMLSDCLRGECGLCGWPSRGATARSTTATCS